MSDLRVGDEVPAFERRITREMARIHGAPMRNFHNELDEAQALGFPDLVIAGPLFTCFYSEMLTRAFGSDWITGGSLEFRLLEPVLANQTIRARAVVTAREAGRTSLEIWCERLEDGVRTSAGTASVRGTATG
jgi:hydroxyacyl-ACP dehydratase HTD2-like protein with hotdog domain